MKSNSYATLHFEADGELIDREVAYPGVKFELYPYGQRLDPDKQSHVLRIKVEGSDRKAVLGNDTIAELIAWLEVNFKRKKG